MKGSPPFKGSRCIITGQTGFIGKVLAADLREKSAELAPRQKTHTSARADITSRRSVKRLFGAERLDFVFHLAGMTESQQSWQMPQRYFDVNVVGTYNMLEALREREDARAIPFVFTSSSSVYGTNTEDLISEDTPPNPVNPYALTKVSAEALCRGFRSTFKLATVILRPFYIAGPGLNRGVVHELAHSVAMAEARQTGRGEVGVADPKVVIDVVDIRDCCQALETIAVRGQAGETYNVCSGKGHAIGEIADIIMSSSEAKLKLVRTGKKRLADIPRLVGNPAKLESLGWSTRHSLEETLVAVLDGCREEIRVRGGRRPSQGLPGGR